MYIHTHMYIATLAPLGVFLASHWPSFGFPLASFGVPFRLPLAVPGLLGLPWTILPSLIQNWTPNCAESIVKQNTPSFLEFTLGLAVPAAVVAPGAFWSPAFTAPSLA